MHLIVAKTVSLPVWHYCTRARFTVLVSCNGEIAVRSCPLLCLQSKAVEPVLKFLSLVPALSVSIFWFRLRLQFQHLKAFGSGSRTIWSKKSLKKHCIICISRLPHKPSPWTGTQISCFGSTIQNCSGSTSTALLQRKVAKLAKGLFWCLSSLRSNNIATNLQTRFSFYLSKIILSFLSTFWVYLKSLNGGP